MFYKQFAFNISDETLKHINLTIWVKRQYFEKHPYNSRLLTQLTQFLVKILLIESLTYICKVDLKDTIWMLLKILKLSLNIRLHETKIPIPDKPCITNKIITSMWYELSFYKQQKVAMREMNQKLECVHYPETEWVSRQKHSKVRWK